MKVSFGYIPSEVLWVYSGPKKATNHWDQVEKGSFSPATVIPVSVAIPDDENSLAFARDYATRLSYDFNDRTKKVAEIKEVLMENKPTTGFKFFGLGTRYTDNKPVGRVTYPNFDKTQPDLYFDLWQDILVDLLRTEGVDPNGFIRGSYVWGRINSEVRLIRVGSELYEALIESGERVILASIPKAKLVPGRVYENKQGNVAVFLGLVDTKELGLTWPNGKSSWYNHYYNTKQKPTVFKKDSKKMLLWYSGSPEGISCAKSLVAGYKSGVAKKIFTGSFAIGRSSSVVRQIDKVEMPENIIEIAREEFLGWCSERISEIQQGQNQNFLSTYSSGSYCLLEKACSYSKFCFIRPAGNKTHPPVPIQVIEDLDKKVGKEI